MKRKLVATGIECDYDNPAKGQLFDINLENFLDSIIEETIILGKKSTAWNKKKAFKYIQMMKTNPGAQYAYTNRNGEVSKYDVCNTLLCVIYDDL